MPTTTAVELNSEHMWYKQATRTYAWWHYRIKEARALDGGTFMVQHGGSNMKSLTPTLARRAAHHGWDSTKSWGYRHVSFGVQKMNFRYMWGI